MKNWLAAASILIFFSCADSREPAAQKDFDHSITSHGKALFQRRCQSCHYVNKDMSGPALKGVRSRWSDSTLLYAFIRNSDSVIQVNPYAKSLWQAWNQTAMNPHPDLKDEDIFAILEYVDASSVK